MELSKSSPAYLLKVPCHHFRLCFDWFYMCMGVLPACLYVYHVHSMPEAAIRFPWDRLELQTAVSHPVDAGSQTLLL